MMGLRNTAGSAAPLLPRYHLQTKPSAHFWSGCSPPRLGSRSAAAMSGS
jgi:hypothetical protein